MRVARHYVQSRSRSRRRGEVAIRKKPTIQPRQTMPKPKRIPSDSEHVDWREEVWQYSTRSVTLKPIQSFTRETTSEHSGRAQEGKGTPNSTPTSTYNASRAAHGANAF